MNHMLVAMLTSYSEVEWRMWQSPVLIFAQFYKAKWYTLYVLPHFLHEGYVYLCIYHKLLYMQKVLECCNQHILYEGIPCYTAYILIWTSTDRLLVYVAKMYMKIFLDSVSLSTRQTLVYFTYLGNSRSYSVYNKQH